MSNEAIVREALGQAFFWVDERNPVEAGSERKKNYAALDALVAERDEWERKAVAIANWEFVSCANLDRAEAAEVEVARLKRVLVEREQWVDENLVAERDEALEEAKAWEQVAFVEHALYKAAEAERDAQEALTYACELAQAAEADNTRLREALDDIETSPEEALRVQSVARAALKETP